MGAEVAARGAERDLRCPLGPCGDASVDRDAERRAGGACPASKDSFDWYRQVIASNGRSLLDRGVMPVAQVTPG